jgi:hypothetical protein
LRVATTINRVRTYASPTFFDTREPLVELDRYGNGFWLETGYDPRNSTLEALRIKPIAVDGRGVVGYFVTGPPGRVYIAEFDAPHALD